MAEDKPKFGFWKIFHLLRNQGKISCNHKKAYRLYKLLKLNIRRRPKKRVPKRDRLSLLQPLRPNLVWSMDFINGSLDCGRKFRVLNVIDNFNREALLVDAGFSFPRTKVAWLIADLIDYKVNLLKSGLIMVRNLSPKHFPAGVNKWELKSVLFNLENRCRMVMLKGLTVLLELKYLIYIILEQLGRLKILLMTG
jgi:hypothetical protein